MHSKRVRLILAATGAAAVLLAAERFDVQVRNDFFAGFAGNREALERAMKQCDQALASNPKQAEAMVWHGAGTFFQAGQSARAGEYQTAGELSKRGQDEMAAAVALEPENVGVLIPRGAALLVASQFVPAPAAKEMLNTGLADYEKVYRLQLPYFDKLSGHARGELLFGLAEGTQRSGDPMRAKDWFEKLAKITDPENGHLQQAKDYLSTGKFTGTAACIGCHVTH